MPDLLLKVREIISEVLGLPVDNIDKDMILLGDNSSIKSRELVEVLLEIEDFLDEEFSVEFDWSSNSAMSEANSLFRSVDSLVSHISKLI